MLASDTHSHVAPPKRSLHRAIVRRIDEVAPAHYQLQLQCPALAQSAKPGQFVHVLTMPNSQNWSFDPLLRRAFSILSAQSNSQGSIELLFRVGGRGTQALAKARVGDEIDLLGPLGQPFDLSPFDVSLASTTQSDEMFHVKQSMPTAILVGGGVGVPPLVFLSQVLHSNKITVHPIIGARTSREIIGFDELSLTSESVRIATDDGSRGHLGRVTDLLDSLLKDLLSGSEISPIVYACGPLPMLRAVAQMCAGMAVRCQVSLEENMPCGIGVCNGCVVRARQPFAGSEIGGKGENQLVGNEWSPYRAYRRVCVEGPACWADEIDWEFQG